MRGLSAINHNFADKSFYLFIYFILFYFVCVCVKVYN